MKNIVVIGSLNQDFVANLPHLPDVGETILAQNLQYHFGGKGANQAFALGKFGANVTMLGAVGDDVAGRNLIKQLKNVGVNTNYIKIVEDQSTGMAWVMVNSQGNNGIVVIPGANENIDISYIKKNMNVIELADIIVMQLEIPIETVEYVAKEAKRMNKYVILDPAPAVCNISEELLKNVDLIKPNETEIKIITGFANDNYEEMAKWLREKGVRNVVISLGEKGVLLDNENDKCQLFSAYKTNAVDTTAAGDSFLAAIAYGISLNYTLENSIDIAQKVASMVVSRHGAQSSIPSLEEFKNILI